MRLFRLGRKGDEGPSTRQEAHAAIERAQADIQAVEDRAPEVNWLYDALRDRRQKNNFGPSLALAMERKTPNADC